MKNRPGEHASLTRSKMYQAVAERDASFEGVFFVAVTTTGIFCRPGCPARTPQGDNCEFFESAGAAMQAGFRPCMRCRPLLPAAGAPAWAERIVERMGKEPERVLSAADIREAGAEPAAASRFFKTRFGASVQALSRARRVGVALRWIREGEAVGRATHRAGFASESGFRKAVKDLFGVAPGEAAKAGVEPIVARWLTSPLGPMLGAASDKGVCLLEFVDRRGLATQLQTLRKRLGRPIVPGRNAHLDRLERELAAYFRDGRAGFTVPLDTPGTEFQTSVWNELRRIKPGQTRSYLQIAERIGRPSAVRAVARANGDNRVGIIIPCHRVIGADGSMTGYGGGVWRKLRLLEHEGAGKTRERSEPGLFARRAREPQGVCA